MIKILDNVNKAYNGIIDDFDKSINNYLEIHQETVQKLTLNEYLGLQGLASPYSDYMIDKVKIPRGLTQRQQNKHDKQALEANEEYHARRDAAIKEYSEKVASGEIVPPTNVERYIKAAKGHPDNKSTQAAIRALTKRGYIQDNNGNWIKSTEVISQNEKDFKQTIDDFLNGNIKPTNQIFVCQTTEVMRVCGADNLDVMIYQDTIRKILSDDLSKFEHPHNLTVDTLKQLPDQLQKPVIVFKGSHEGSIVLVTNLFNENSEQIIISCELNSINKRHEINRITSMYGKENIANYINTQIKKDNLIGCHKKIANQMLQSVGLYLPSEETFIDYTDIISDSDKNVNRNNLTNEERIMEDKIYAPETTIYFENQKVFDELTANPNIRYHFHNHYFSNIKFTDKNIIGHLGKCIFNRCTFENFNGSNIDLSESSFTDCKIVNSNFENSSFYNAGIRYSQIVNSDFSNTDFFLAEIRHSALKGNNLSGVNFSRADLKDVHINNSIINEPVQNLTSEQITMDGSTHQEIEAHRTHIFEDLKLEPISFEQIAEQAKASLEPLPETTSNNIETHIKNTNEQSTTLSDEKNKLVKSQPKYELREIAQWSDDKNYLSFSIVIDDYLFDGTFRINDDVNGKGMSIVGINCYSSRQENQVSDIWDELTKQLQDKATEIKQADKSAELKTAINNQLESADELPVDVLCDDGKIEWYSFASGINDTEKVKELLQKIQRTEKQVVSIYGDNTNNQLLYLNDDLQIVPYDENLYPNADAALKAVLENENIAKLVPYEDMLQSSSAQDLKIISESNNNKYPYIQINWSDNSELAQESCLPFDKAEKLFKDINEVNPDKGLLEKTSISLFLDRQNTYNLELKLGAESGGTVEHLNQLINESDISSDKSLQHLQEYLKNNGLIAAQDLQSEQTAQLDLFDFTEIT